ncbi:MAG: phosphatidylglycerol lysyltransferase domain-containing protein [Ktedonobacteraceae bacterium]
MKTRIKAAQTLHFYRSRYLVRLTLALAAGLTGLMNMLSIISPKPDWGMVLSTWPLNIHQGMPKLIVVCGFFLLMLFPGLTRGKHEAWCTAVIFLFLSTLFRLQDGSQVFLSMITSGLVMLFVLCSRFFQAKSDPPSMWRGYLALIGGLSVVILYTIGGFLILSKDFEPVVDRYGIEEVLLRLFTHTHLYFTPGTQAFVFGHVLPMLCLSAVLYGVVKVLRPVAATLFPDEQARQAVAGLTHLYGKNSISYFALGMDKSYFFSASRKSVISYVLEGRVAVVAGDPIGPEEEMLTTIQQFLAFCSEQDWTTVFWQVCDTTAALYRKAGLHLVKIGEDAIITPQAFTLAGNAMANVRASAKRAEKEGLRIVITHGQVQDSTQLAQMERISQVWLASKGSAEMGFSMGHFDPYGDNEQIYALAVDDNNKVHAFVTFVPIYGWHGWGLDLMRRAEQAAPGTMELLLARSIEYFKKEGSDRVSLGLAPLSNINHTDETFVGTSIDFLTHRFGNPAKNHSLFTFKKKFQPQWESRYLVYSHTLTLPTVGWALYRAHQQDVSLPRACVRFLGGHQLRRHATPRSAAELARVPSHS